MTQGTGIKCPKCDGMLRLRHGRNGAFIGCDMYPTCNYTSNDLPGTENLHLKDMSREKAMHVLINGSLVRHSKTNAIWSYSEGRFFKNGEQATHLLMQEAGFDLYYGEINNELELEEKEPFYAPLKIAEAHVTGVNFSLRAMRLPKDGVRKYTKEENLKRAKNLILAGTDHAKFSRGIMLYVTVKMQAGFMIEFETYRHGVEVISTSSSMHNELKELTGEALAEKKQVDLSKKIYTRSMTISFQALRAIYIARRTHRHPDWQIFCDFIERIPHFETLIMPENSPGE